MGFYYDMHVDIDVFLCKACKILGGWTSANGVLFMKNLDMLLIYLNLTVSCFEDILSNVAIIDKNKILTHILKYAEIVLLKFWRETYIIFFHEFFDLFDQLNKSVCYRNDKVKPKFGHYYAPRPTLSVMFI